MDSYSDHTSTGGVTPARVRQHRSSRAQSWAGTRPGRKARSHLVQGAKTYLRPATWSAYTVEAIQDGGDSVYDQAVAAGLVKPSSWSSTATPNPSGTRASNAPQDATPYVVTILDADDL